MKGLLILFWVDYTFALRSMLKMVLKSFSVPQKGKSCFSFCIFVQLVVRSSCLLQPTFVYAHLAGRRGFLMSPIDEVLLGAYEAYPAEDEPSHRRPAAVGRILAMQLGEEPQGRVMSRYLYYFPVHK
ncbi:hypothetical protein KBY65_07890 [Cyanobium sp. Alchichica 3B3-8F6]|uniref:hypothetical protein n=1 Tax=Cyanobium sp. Alchichica 3B3-8F6 TaxID=2823696 RepID=UPI0020CC7819|nr:hypothetical protein [Cyanobium sp. Alchichica 3B3-8F6]MCP9882400.1 hypothetical protein [Cyanobium sp. Alchichica 3B3-8F6]